MILEAFLALALIKGSDAGALQAVQRADVGRYVRKYDATVSPTVDAVNDAYTGWETFIPGSDHAVRISSGLQTALDKCAPTPKRITAIPAPSTLGKAGSDAFATYARAKSATYTHRCAELRAWIGYVDDPSKSSAKASAQRAEAKDRAMHARATKAVSPVFKSLQMKYPASW